MSEFNSSGWDNDDTASIASTYVCYDWQAPVPCVTQGSSPCRSMSTDCGQTSPQMYNCSVYVDSDNSSRTTVMLKNIPNRYSQPMLAAAMNHKGFRGSYDFLYAPIDFQNKGNMGYAFINFVCEASAVFFISVFDGYCLPSCRSRKVCKASWARLQGLKANVDHLINSPVNEMPDEFKPMLFDSNGAQIPFPLPQREHAQIRPRKHRGVNGKNATRSNKVFLGGLHVDTEEGDLVEMCEQFGAVEEVSIIYDCDSGVSRGFGFCTFSQDKSASALLSTQAGSLLLRGKAISVKPYTSNR